MEKWEKDLNTDMESIRASYKSIRRNYYIIMGILITWVARSVIGMVM